MRCDCIPSTIARVAREHVAKSLGTAQPYNPILHAIRALPGKRSTHKIHYTVLGPVVAGAELRV